MTYNTSNKAYLSRSKSLKSTSTQKLVNHRNMSKCQSLLFTSGSNIPVITYTQGHRVTRFCIYKCFVFCSLQSCTVHVSISANSQFDRDRWTSIGPVQQCSQVWTQGSTGWSQGGNGTAGASSASLVWCLPLIDKESWGFFAMVSTVTSQQDGSGFELASGLGHSCEGIACCACVGFFPKMLWFSSTNQRQADYFNRLL